MNDDLAALLAIAAVTPPEDRRADLLAGMANLREAAAIVRRLAKGEPATVFRVDPLG